MRGIRLQSSNSKSSEAIRACHRIDPDGTHNTHVFNRLWSTWRSPFSCNNADSLCSIFIQQSTVLLIAKPCRASESYKTPCRCAWLKCFQHVFNCMWKKGSVYTCQRRCQQYYGLQVTAISKSVDGSTKQLPPAEKKWDYLERQNEARVLWSRSISWLCWLCI